MTSITRCIAAGVAILLGAAAIHLQADERPSWQRPLAEKERLIEANILARHNILGLYPSVVEVPADDVPMDNTTAAPYSNVAHAVVWTSNYLAGASYRYATLKKQGAPSAVVGSAQLRADEIFEAVYRCLRVTGKPGLLARGYLLGHGPTYEERNGSAGSDEWHQGTVDGQPLRWRGSPSHHIYSAAAYGIGQYYDLAAEGLQKTRARDALEALVGYWVDNNYKIEHFDSQRPPVPILGLTDGRTLDTTALMALSAAKIAHHATGNEKFQRAYETLVSRYGVRNLKKFRAPKDFDDALHCFNHLEVLLRIEDDPALHEAYRKIADGLWRNHKQDGQSLFTYVYYALRPNEPGRDEALALAHQALFTWPTDMTIQPRMSSLETDLKPPYPTYAARWDNEYIWKGDLLHGDGRYSRTVVGVAASAEDPEVLAAVDERGELYLSLDGAQIAAGWRPLETPSGSPVRAVDFGPKTRFLAVACDNGFHLSTTAGKAWKRLPVPEDGGKPVDVRFDPRSACGLYAVTARGVYRSRDLGEELCGENWEPLTGGLAQTGEFQFAQSFADPPRLYARRGAQVFTRNIDEGRWQPAGRVGLGELARGQQRPLDWLALDPRDSSHALFGVELRLGSGPSRTLFQETRDAGKNWSHNADSMERLFADGKVVPVVFSLPPFSIQGLVFDMHRKDQLYGIVERGIIKSVDGGKSWRQKQSGFDIPIVRTLLAPRQTEWLFAGTPSGLFLSKDAGETWQDGHLVLQFDKNRRRELGGAEFIDAYWRARYHGFLDDATAASFVLDADAAGVPAWNDFKSDGAQQAAKPLVDSFRARKFPDLQVALDCEPKDAAGRRRGSEQIVIAPIRDLRIEKNYPEVMRDPGCGMALLFVPRRWQLVVNGKAVDDDNVRQVAATPSQHDAMSAYLLAVRDRKSEGWHLCIYGTPAKPLLDAEIDVVTTPAPKRQPVDLEVTELKNGRKRVTVWIFGEHHATCEFVAASPGK